MRPADKPGNWRRFGLEIHRHMTGLADLREALPVGASPELTEQVLGALAAAEIALQQAKRLVTGHVARRKSFSDHQK